MRIINISNGDMNIEGLTIPRGKSITAEISAETEERLKQYKKYISVCVEKPVADMEKSSVLIKGEAMISEEPFLGEEIEKNFVGEKFEEEQEIA